MALIVHQNFDTMQNGTENLANPIKSYDTELRLHESLFFYNFINLEKQL